MKALTRHRACYTGALLPLTLLFAGGTCLQADQSQVLKVGPAQPYATPQEALAEASDGDTIEVLSGVYRGPLVVTRSVSLLGREYPIIDGGGKGTVVRILAPRVVFKGFVVKNSGAALAEENSGIAVQAPYAKIQNNRLQNTLFGIYLQKADKTLIENNVIQSKNLALPRRGDPIRVWFSKEVSIESNAITRGRDVVLWYSNNLQIRNNSISEGRYGLHFMYCDDSLVERNRLTENSVGAFLMYSRRLRLLHNVIAHNRGASGYGVGLKDMDDPSLHENLIADNRIGLYLDNSPRELESQVRITGNVLVYNDVGCHLLPSVKRNYFEENNFIENREQVRIERGGSPLDNFWEGNYWSDYVGFDSNGDGRGEMVYRADRLFENLMERNPFFRIFLYNPSTEAID